MQTFSRLAAIGLVVSVGACEGGDPASVGHLNQDINSENGLSVNGLSVNGLSVNGLSVNGLSTNGLATSAFSTWFNQNLDTTPSVMSYIVKCALPGASSLSWTNPMTGTAYAWPGNLGLAPTWASGQPATTTEQQLITACLAAHANKYGLHIQLAVEGRDSQGAQIPTSLGELLTYSVHEGCFFGNLFTGDGIFSGTADLAYSPANSSPRACALETPLSDSTTCAPIQDVGPCLRYCKPDLTGTYYSSCTYQGKTYQPLATRIHPSDVYRCGDGTCQFTESCGTGNTASSCRADCGLCPGS